MDRNYIDSDGYRRIYDMTLKALVSEYRLSHPEINDLTDEEVALMCPVSPEVYKLFAVYRLDEISKIISDFQDEIAFNDAKMDDPRTFHQEITELRSDNVAIMRIIERFKKEKEQILESVKVINEEYGIRDR